MREKQLDLRPFRHRIRLVRAWRGLAVGLLTGGAFGLVWAVLDLTGVWLAEWLWLGLVFAGAGVLCALVGAILPVRDDAVARSVDRRAGLRDRLGTMIERTGADESFDSAQRHDTEAHVAALKARKVYPVRMGRWQYVALVSVALASLVFLLGNTWYVFDADARKAKEELEKIAAQIERVAKPILDRKDATEEEKSFANELDAFARRMEKGKMTKEEAMQRANELAKQAEKLTRERTDRAFEKMQTAREQMTLSKLSDKGLDKKALEKLNMGERQQQLLQQLQKELGIDPKAGGDKFGKEQMDQLGLQQYDPSLLNLTDEERDKLRELIQERLNDLDKKLATQNLTPDEMKSILESKQQLQEMQEQLEVSDEMRKALEEFMNSPEFKDIMKAVDKMRDAAQQVNDGQPLSEQQIQDLEKMLDDLEQKLEGSEYKDMVMEQMRAALEMLKAGKATCEAGGT
jgi:DNA repair exonuclease SbcCD ATPase subunit